MASDPARPAIGDPSDELVRTVSGDGDVSVRALVATGLVREASTRHAAARTASSALGRTLMGALLLSAGAKDRDERVQVQLRGSGPLGVLLAIADGAGRVRGYVGNPAADPPPRAGKPDVAAAIGRGVVTVVRSHPRWKTPQTGIVPITAGEIARDLTHYLAESEQKPSALSLGVYLDRAGRVEAAGGFLVQALPGARDAVLARVEANVQALPGVSRLVRDGLGADGLVDLVLAGVGVGARQRGTPRFHCPCSRERVLRGVALLGSEELHAIAREAEPVEVVCEFCGERRSVDPAEVLSLLETRGGVA